MLSGLFSRLQPSSRKQVIFLKHFPEDSGKCFPSKQTILGIIRIGKSHFQTYKVSFQEYHAFLLCFSVCRLIYGALFTLSPDQEKEFWLISINPSVLGEGWDWNQDQRFTGQSIEN